MEKKTFRIFRELAQKLKALKPGFKGAPIELTRLNRRSLGKQGLKTLKNVAPALALTFLSLPVARAIQARYAPKRKFRKEFRKGIKRGITEPFIGAGAGIPLQKGLGQASIFEKIKVYQKN